MNTASVRRRIEASPAAVYRALTDGDAVRRWRAPDGMTATVHQFEAREGGSFRITLSYDDATRSGKTAGNADTYGGHFRELVPGHRVVEAVEFETSDARLMGEMTITTTLQDVDGQTEVTVVFEHLPEGVPSDDNAVGTEMALANLARLVERT